MFRIVSLVFALNVIPFDSQGSEMAKSQEFEAETLLKELADLGDPEAQNNLGAVFEAMGRVICPEPVLGALLAFVCGLAHPRRRVKFPLVLGSLAYFALGYQVLLAPSLGQ